MSNLHLVRPQFRYSSRQEYEAELELKAESMEGGGANEEEYDDLLDEYIRFCEERDA